MKPDKSIVYFNKNTDGESTVVECGNNQYNLECVNAKDNVVLSNLSDEDSCRIGKGVWEQFEWRQTPNANEALTCFEGCGGWCVRDDGKTEEISEKRCTVTGENCENDTDCACDHPPISEETCLFVASGQFNIGKDATLVAGSWNDRPSGCSVKKDSTVYFNRNSGVGGNDQYITVEHVDPACNQTCKPTIATCKTFSRSVNVNRFCSATGEDSNLCRAIAKGTYIKSGPVIKRQTAGKEGHWDIQGKCGLGFAAKYDPEVDWCGPLKMQQSDEFIRCEESMYVSQMCEVKLPDEILPMPFAIQTRRFPRVMGECKRSSKEDCKTEADIRGILFEEKDVGSDNHCNVLGARISEHSMSKTMTFGQGESLLRRKGGRLATRSEVLAAMAYLPDEGDSWTPVSGGPGNDWMQIGEKNWPYGDMHEELNNGAYGRPSWGSDGTTEHAFRKPCSTRPASNWCGERE